METKEELMGEVSAMFPDETQAFEDPAERNICDSCQ